MWVLNVLNYCDRTLPVAFANFIMPELHLTATELGILTGIGFMTVNAFTGLISGSVADVVHRPRLISAGMLLWSVLTAVSGLAHGFVGLLLPRIFVGIGESVLAPSVLSLIPDYFPASQLALATGCFFSAVNMGAGSSLLLAGLAGERLGWRFLFFMLGGVGACLALAVPLIVREPRAAERAHGAQRRLRERLATLGTNLQLAAVFFHRCPSLVLVTTGAIGLGWAGAVHSFIQPWMTHERGFSRSEAALSTGLVVLSVGTVASPLAGWGADCAYRRTGLPKVTFAALLLLAIQLPSGVCFLLGSEPRSPLFWASLAAWLLGNAVMSPVFSTVQELSPPPLRGTILGLSLLVLNLLGVAMGNLVVGLMVDGLTAAGAANPLTDALVAMLLASTCMQVTCYLAAGWRVDRDLKAVQAEYVSLKSGAVCRT